MQKGLLRENGANSRNKKPMGALNSIIKGRDESPGGLDLFHSLKSELRRSEEPDQRKRAVSIKHSALEEDLYSEREKNRLLELEINTLEVELAKTRKQLDATIAKSTQHMKFTQEELRKLKFQEEQRRSELSYAKEEAAQAREDFCVLESRISELRRVAKTSFEFVVWCYQMVSQLPDRVEMSEMNQEAAEFSFDEKRVIPTIVDKEDFIKAKIVKFLHSNSETLDDLGVNELLLKLTEISSEKKPSPKERSPKRSRSPSKQRNPKKDTQVKQDAVVAKHEINDSLLENGLNKSWQTSSGGKNNSYNISINLILNEESMISEANQSNSIVATANLNASLQGNILKGFDQELGYEKSDESESLLPSDSLMYSASDRRPVEESQLVCKALYNFQEQNSGDMTILKGDVITVLAKSPTGWWIGTNQRSNQCGQFPSNYVQVVI